MNLDLRQIWNGLRKRWWLALIVMLTAAGVAYLSQAVQTPIYQAQTTLVAKPIMTGPEANAIIEAIKKTMPTYAQELGSRPLWEYVVDDNLIRTVNVDALPGQIKVQARPDQNQLVMTVDNPNALQAAQIAEGIADEFIARQDATTQGLPGGSQVVWVIAQPAEVPARPYLPRPLLYAAAAALFGLILGLLLAAIIELLDTTLKTPADVQQYAELNTLGIIPRSSK